MSDESIFAEALAIPNPAAREEYLDQACAENPELRREIEALLAAHAGANPLDRPPEYQVATELTDEGPPPAEVGDTIGPYRLMEQIGEGGFGLVFVAEQHEPVRRKVALKVLKPGMDTRDVVARFEAERQALALMDHPNIAKVLDAGSTPNGRPYFVMELVKGIPINQYCDEQRLSPTERLELFAQVCQAVQHAHQKGIIHRDIKPTNVLVTVIDGKPVPKVIDFGVAKAVGQNLTERTIYTRFAQLVGTPLYMSPEQAQLSGVDVDTRSDIYSLGVLLYELLTGTTPFDSKRFRTAALEEIRRIIREEDPPRPSHRLSSLGDTLPSVSANRKTEPARLPGLIRGELDWIVMKCLEKDRDRRYETANGLARDVQRYLRGEAVTAHPPSLLYRLKKNFRKHRTALTFTIAIAICLILGTTVSTWQAVRALHAEEMASQSAVTAEQKRKEADNQRIIAQREKENVQSERDESQRQRELAETQRRAAEKNLATSQFLLARIANTEGDLPEALSWYFQAYLNTANDVPRRRSALNLIGAWGGELKQTLVHENGVHTVAISADGKKMLTGYFNSRAQAWDLESGSPMGKPLPHAGDIVSAQLSSDGNFALTGDWDGARVWDLSTGQLRFPLLEHEVREDTVVGPVLSPNDQIIATRSPFTAVRLWNAETGQPLGKPLELGKFVYRIQFSPDSSSVLALGGQLAKVWKVDSSSQIGESVANATDVTFHPDKPVIAVSCTDGKLLLRDLDTGQQLAELAHENPLKAVEFNASGTSLIARDNDHAYLWLNVLSDDRTQRTLPHGRQIHTATFSPVDDTILTASSFALRLWSQKSDDPVWERSIPRNLSRWRSDRIRSVRFSPDGQSMLTRTFDGAVEVIAVSDGRRLAREKNVIAETFSPDGKTFFAGSRDGWVRARSVDAADRRRIPIPPSLTGGPKALSPDGKLLFTVGRESSSLYRTDTWEQIGKSTNELYHDWKDAVSGAAFSPDGKILVTNMSLRGDGPPPFFNPSTKITFWDTSTMKPIGEPLAREGSGSGVTFDQSGKFVLVGKVLYDVETHEHKAAAPDQIPKNYRSILQLLGTQNTIAPPLWDASRDAPTIVRIPAETKRAILTADGRRMLVTAEDGTSQLYEVGSTQPTGAAFRAGGYSSNLTRDGRYAFYRDNYTSRLWDTQTGRSIGEPLRSNPNVQVSFSPDGTILAIHEDFSAQLIDSATGLPLSPLLRLRSNQISRPMFSPDGRKLYIASAGVNLWNVPVPAEDDPERLRLSLEVRTGLRVDENMSIQKLSQAEWLQRKTRLAELGGPCDVRE